MAVTNVKTTWLSKLLGQTNDKKNLPEEGMPMVNPAAGANPGLRFQNQTPLFGPNGIGAASQAAPVPAPAPRSRYNLFEMTQPQPTRDAESEEMIKRRAKVNAFGAGISGLAGLASMATGGDVPQPVDLQTPWNMDQAFMLDQDYRGRLQNWIDQGFQVDQANTQLQNREIEQDIDYENRMAQINQQGQNQQILAEQKAQYALQQLQAKTQEQQMQEMMGMGIDPNQPDAYEKYLQANRNKFNTDLNYTKARTNWNNRTPKAGGTSVGSSGGYQYPLSTMKKGRDAMISQLEAQVKELSKDPALRIANAEEIKSLQEQIKNVRNINPGANELLDADIAELGYQLEEQEMGGGTPKAGPTGTQQGAAMQFDQSRGFTNVPKEQDPIIKGRLSSGFQKAFQGTMTQDDLAQMIQDLIDAGEAGDEEEAYFYIEKFIEENQNQ